MDILLFLIHTLLFIECLSDQANNTFSFSNVYDDYMVLQQAPFKAKIWGFSTAVNDAITVTLTDTDKNTIIQTVNTVAKRDAEFNVTIWTVSFAPVETSFSNYTISAKSSKLNSIISLKNVLFGDVFICSGQSNMVRMVNYVINASQEIQDANNYPFIRIMTVQPITANQPQIEIDQIELKWSIANNISVGGGPNLNGAYFSAVCWFFGRDLYQTLNYPLGLIETAYGGTSIHAWSSPSVLKSCNTSINDYPMSADINDGYNITGVGSTQLWNAMVYPFLSTTIKAAIWYQGEADSSQPACNYYNCLIKAMINDWRLQWSLKSDTSNLFPFGIVQLSSWNDQQNITCANNTACTATAIVRNAQTGNYGYVPNKDMLQTFFATAIDLGDPNGTAGDVHPRFKQQVGRRLADAGLNVIYGESDIYWFGPIADKAMYNTTGNSVLVNFRNVGQYGLQINNFVGFEVFDSDKHWIVANKSVVVQGNYNIVIALMENVNSVSMIRYNWYRAPCNPDDGILNCAIYDQQYQLPAIPFILPVS